MKIARLSILLPLVALATTGFAQNWSRAYDEGLSAARQGKWAEAREAFKRAVSLRPEDASNATLLPGPPTERRRWRDGAPYSPNFLAAYSLYRVALTEQGDTRTADLNTAAGELEALLQKGQNSRESYYFLNQIYQATGDSAKRMSLEERFGKSQDKLTWHIDTEVVAPEDISAIGNAAGAPTINPGAGTVTINARDLKPGTGMPDNAVLVPGRVSPVATKYALIVGNSESRLGSTLPFAADDAQRLREAIVTNAGYPEENVELVVNATAAQMLASAKALADRVPADGTVMIYFTGSGTNIDGKDYLAGVDTTSSTDTASMLRKADLFQVFMAKGAHIFAFFQANRPVESGHYFGSEIPMIGSLAQAQATLPGEEITSTIQGGKTIGRFTNAFIEVLQELKSNQLPILEFGWQVFYKIRRGNTGTTGGGSRQTPTLPVLTNLASDARF